MESHFLISEHVLEGQKLLGMSSKRKKELTGAISLLHLPSINTQLPAGLPTYPTYIASTATHSPPLDRVIPLIHIIGQPASVQALRVPFFIGMPVCKTG